MKDYDFLAMQKIRIFKEIRMWDFVFGFMEKKNSNLAEIS
jgi:hypothetical protein